MIEYRRSLHESIVDGNDEDLASGGELRMGNESWDVRVRAGWAY